MASEFVCAACGQAGHAAHWCLCCPQCGGTKSHSARRCYRCAYPGREPRRPTRHVGVQPAAVPGRPAQRALRFRTYCVSCGRSTEVNMPTARPGRCSTCGGTQLTEVD
jgi:hypothetical protein